MSIFAVLRRLEFLTRPAPSLAHDYDVLVQDVDDEVWAPFTPDGRCIFCGKTRDYIAMSDGDGASVCLGPLCPNTSGPSPVTTHTSAGDRPLGATPPASSGPLELLRTLLGASYEDARKGRNAADPLSGEWQWHAGRGTALSEVLGMLDNLIDGPGDGGPELW